MKIKNWEIEFENYWASKCLCSFYFMFFTWSESFADYNICFCNFNISIYNSKKDDKFWEKNALTDEQLKKIDDWLSEEKALKAADDLEEELFYDPNL